ncbi:glycosyltransferase [Cereibacter sp. SYSU M97828]|nr:glycosyltransferase [Cereibacter flavus]
MRICLSPGTIGGGGIGIVMLNLAEEFVRRGHEVDLLLLEEETHRTAPPGVTVVHLGRRARSGILNAARHLRRTRPDILISARDYVNVAMMAAHRLARLGRATRLVWSFHTHRGSQLAGVPRRADILADRLTRLLVGRADALVAVSAGVGRDIEAAFALPVGRVQVIENPVWTPARRRLAEAPAPHEWFAQGPVVVAMGRLTVQKDFPTLLQAFRALPDARLVILGEGEDRAALEAMTVGMEDRILMPGHVENPLAWLTHADLFVLSSRWEGFPLSLVEALGCGCPVVSTDCPSGPSEIVTPGLGRLVPVGDAAAMSVAMADALRDPGDPAPRRAAALRFDAERAADLYLKAAGYG